MALNRFQTKILVYNNFKYKWQLHAVSRMLQDRQTEPSVNKLRSPISAKFLRMRILRIEWRNSTPRLALHQSEERKH